MIASPTRPLPLASLALLAACAASAGATRTLSDADIRAYVDRGFDKRAMMGRHEVIGIHNGVAVVADYPCSDLCPAYTSQIIHYDAEPGPACDRAGGVVRIRTVPIAIAVQRKPFCVPKVVAGPES